MAVSDLNWTTMTQKDWKQDPIGKYQGSKIHVSDPKLIMKDPKKCRWSWKINKVCSHNGSFRSELNNMMTQKDWKQDPIGMNQGSKNTCFRPKIDHERSKKNAYEFGKSLNSALIMAVSDLNWTTMTQKDWKQDPIGKYQGSKIHVSDPKLIMKDPKKCRWSWKTIKFCSHNGSFRSELNNMMTQKDWKQDPIGIYQGSKNTCFRPKIDHVISKKRRWSRKIIKLCSHNGSFRSELNNTMTQKDWKQDTIGI